MNIMRKLENNNPKLKIARKNKRLIDAINTWMKTTCHSEYCGNCLLYQVEDGDGSSLCSLISIVNDHIRFVSDKSKEEYFTTGEVEEILYRN